MIISWKQAPASAVLWREIRPQGAMWRVTPTETQVIGCMLWLTFGLFAVGLFVIAKGGGWFADGAIAVAARTGVPKIIIGATLMSFATTLPEFTVSFVASLGGSSATAVGNALGSTICNVGLILAIAVIIHPLKKARIELSPLVVTLGTLLLMGFLAFDYTITRTDGMILFAVLVGFLLWQVQRIRTMRQGKEDDEEETLEGYEAISTPRAIMLFVVGGIAVVVGSRLVVSNGIELARLLGVSELVIGLTLVSIGTSLPELVASVSAARRGHTDLATGNILGANLFNLAFVLPGAAMVRPLPLDVHSLTIDLPVSLLLMVSVGLGLARGSLRRGWGIVALGIYFTWMTYLFVA